MQKRSGFMIVLLAFILSAGFLSAQTGTLKDTGVGLIIQDADYDKRLKIVQRGDAWDLEDRYANGALTNTYGENQGLAAWIVGPHTDTHRNKNGLPVWDYTYTAMFPNGSSYNGGPAGFSGPGVATVGISIGGGTSGTRKVNCTS